MRKKVTLILVFIALFSGNTFACGKAYNYKLYPIGNTKTDIIVLETSLNRYWDRKNNVLVAKRNRTRWKGIITLKGITNDGKLYLIDIIDTIDISDRKYNKELKPYFLKAIEEAKKIEDFNISSNISLNSCDLTKQCGKLKLVSNTEKEIILEKENNRYNIKLPQSVIMNSAPSGGILHQDFRIQSIRKMKILNTEYLIIHIASGEIDNSVYDYNKEKKKKQFKKITNSIYKETTLYHGLGFDIIMNNI